MQMIMGQLMLNGKRYRLALMLYQLKVEKVYIVDVLASTNVKILKTGRRNKHLVQDTLDRVVG